MKVGMIWAQSQQGVIGNQGKLPWHLPEDLAHFKAMTDGCPVIMGRLTNESLPAPLHGRIPITITSDSLYWPQHGGLTVPTLRHALGQARMFRSEWCWIIGGGQILREAIEADVADFAIVTTVRIKDGASIIQGDVTAPAFEPSDWDRKSYYPKNGGWFPSRSRPELEWRVTEMERKRG